MNPETPYRSCRVRSGPHPGAECRRCDSHPVAVRPSPRPTPLRDACACAAGGCAPRADGATRAPLRVGRRAAPVAARRGAHLLDWGASPHRGQVRGVAEPAGVATRALLQPSPLHPQQGVGRLVRPGFARWWDAVHRQYVEQLRGQGLRVRASGEHGDTQRAVTRRVPARVTRWGLA